MDSSSPTTDHYLDPLPMDLAYVTTKSSLTNDLTLSNLDQIIHRLELARSQLVGSTTTTTTEGEVSMEEEEEDDVGGAGGGGGGGGGVANTLLPLSSFVKKANQQTGSAHKEWSLAVNKFGKGVDKKFTGPPTPLFPSPSPPPTSTNNTTSTDPTPSQLSPFSSPLAITSLNNTIALHLARTGSFSTLSTFLSESSTPSLPSSLLSSLESLHLILEDLRKGVCTSALEWIESSSREEEGGEQTDVEQDLEFALRKEEYIRLLLAGSDLSSSASEREPLLPIVATTTNSNGYTKPTPTTIDSNIVQALQYGGHHFRQLLTPSRHSLICSLLSAPHYMPLSRLLSSPYSNLFTPYLSSSSPTSESPLCLQFATAFLKKVELPRDSPLSVVTDIGGGGAMARIQKVRNVMKEKKTEWSAVGELPVEIPLPTTRRYHSIFACPVAREQSTIKNPPMLLPCGHVIAKESLERLARGTPTVKCPYCPIVSHTANAILVRF